MFSALQRLCVAYNICHVSIYFIHKSFDMTIVVIPESTKSNLHIKTFLDDIHVCGGKDIRRAGHIPLNVPFAFEAVYCAKSEWGSRG